MFCHFSIGINECIFRAREVPCIHTYYCCCGGEELLEYSFMNALTDIFRVLKRQLSNLYVNYLFNFSNLAKDSQLVHFFVCFVLCVTKLISLQNLVVYTNFLATCCKVVIYGFLFCSVATCYVSMFQKWLSVVYTTGTCISLQISFASKHN